MSKYIPLIFFISLTLCNASIIREFEPFEVRNVNSNVEHELAIARPPVLPVRTNINEIKAKWMPHITDFIDLIDLDKVIKVYLEHVGDTAVINFIGFVTSKEFRDILVRFQDIEEFKEAVNHLQSKGYDVQALIDYINSKLVLPAFEFVKLPYNDGSELTAIITEIINVLPLEDMKGLFEEKLKKHQEVRELFRTLSSKKFTDIIQRLRQNPKYLEIRGVFESYGLDFEYLRALAKNFKIYCL